MATWRRGLAWLRGLPAGAEAAPAGAAARPLRPVIVPSSLADLQGPGSGVVELPVRLYWSSGARQFDLADPDQVAAMYDAVIDGAAVIGDITRHLNAGLLARAWPYLGMSRAKRQAWENRFPVLRRQRLSAA
ncbi:MAG TPA: hypothetical protein VMG38_26000 [Trebonia sp.]|nr:hypothetical protein [Trebonia sp.]